jgi:hypothetical protein
MKRISVWCLVILITLAPVLIPSPALAANLDSNVASTALSLTVSETLSVTSTSAISFTYNASNGTAVASGNITTTYSWNLANTRTQIDFAVWLGSASAALTNGTTNIPSSEVYVDWNTGSGPQACSGTDSATPGSVPGAACTYNGTNGFSEGLVATATVPAQPVEFANIPFTGTQNFTYTVSMAGLPILSTGSYAGTINFEAVAQ